MYQIISLTLFTNFGWILGLIIWDVNRIFFVESSYLCIVCCILRQFIGINFALRRKIWALKFLNDDAFARINEVLTLWCNFRQIVFLESQHIRIICGWLTNKLICCPISRASSQLLRIAWILLSTWALLRHILLWCSLSLQFTFYCLVRAALLARFRLTRRLWRTDHIFHHFRLVQNRTFLTVFFFFVCCLRLIWILGPTARFAHLYFGVGAAALLLHVGFKS